jgi:hypothetical protein
MPKHARIQPFARWHTSARTVAHGDAEDKEDGDEEETECMLQAISTVLVGVASDYLERKLDSVEELYEDRKALKKKARAKGKNKGKRKK